GAEATRGEPFPPTPAEAYERNSLSCLTGPDRAPKVSAMRKGESARVVAPLYQSKRLRVHVAARRTRDRNRGMVDAQVRPACGRQVCPDTISVGRGDATDGMAEMGLDLVDVALPHPCLKRARRPAARALGFDESDACPVSGEDEIRGLARCARSAAQILEMVRPDIAVVNHRKITEACRHGARKIALDVVL